MLFVSLWNMRRVDMSIWIQLLVLLFYNVKHADSLLYVSEEYVASVAAASVCNLSTPDINYKTGGNTVLLDGTNLNISDEESVWSGYVQTYAAFLYQGCCEERVANSSAVYTDMNSDPGECYSKCKTEVIGMQTTTCHCNPRPIKANTYAPGCNITCSDPAGTACGGSKAVSIYKQVKYPGSGDSAVSENCRAFHWDYSPLQFFTWMDCWQKYHFLCDIDLTPSTQFDYHTYSNNWKTAADLCLKNDSKPVAELSSGYPGLISFPNPNIWIGQIRSRVIGKNADSNNQTSQWRRGVITKEGGNYKLQFKTSLTKLKSLCEYELTSAPFSSTSLSHSSEFTSVTVPGTSIQSSHMSSPPTTRTSEEYRNSSDQKSQPIAKQQFAMIAVYAAVPVVLVLVTVVVIVILYKRRKLTEVKRDDQALNQNNDYSILASRNSVSNESYQDDDVRHDYLILEPVNDYAVVKDADIKAASDNEYDTTTNMRTNANDTSNDTDNVYNKLETLADDTYITRLQLLLLSMIRTIRPHMMSRIQHTILPIHCLVP